MKKNFFKKLALVLALVMVATSINYVPASAASAPAWKAKKTVISLGNTYTYGVKNVNKKYKVTYTSSKTSVGTINKTSGKFTAKKAGKTNLHAIVKNGSKTVKDLVQKVEVKAPAWKNTKSTMEAGERSTFTVTYKATGSTQKWSSSNKEVAKVSSKGSVLAVGVGTATITTKVYDKNGTRLKTLKTDVTVSGLQLASATQKSVTKVAAKFSGSMKDEKVTAASFSVVRDDNAVFTIKSVEVDKADASVINIETYSSMNDGKEYTVTYDEKSVKFTATEGNVADVAVTPSVVTAGKKKDVSIQTLDSNGVILTDEKIDSVSSNIEYTLNPTNGYVEGSKIYLPEIGNTATVKVTYHTYKYDETGKETGAIEKEFTITAVADDSTVSNYKVTVGTAKPAWSATSFEANTKVVIGETPKAYFLIKDSNNDEIASDEYPKYKVQSSDTSKLLITETSLTFDDQKKTGSEGVNLVGVSEGTAYIIIKDADKGNTLTTLPIVVTSKKKVVTMEMDKTTVSISTAAGVTTAQAKAKDQYGNRMIHPDVNYDISLVSYPSGASSSSVVASKSAIYNVATTGAITVTGEALQKIGGKFGTYKFKITATDGDKNTASRDFSVNVVKAAGGTGTNEIVLSDQTVDTTVTKDTTSAAKIEVKLGEKKSGVIVGYTEMKAVSSVTIKKSNGTVLASSGKAVSNPVTHAGIVFGSSGDAILVTVNASTGDGKAAASAYHKVLDPGTYTVNIVLNGKTISKSFTVKDSQPDVAKVEIKDKAALDANGADAKSYLVNPSDNIVISYNGIQPASVDIKEVKGTALSGDSVYVEKILVSVEIPSGNSSVFVYVWAKVGLTFTNCTGLGN